MTMRFYSIAASRACSLEGRAVLETGIRPEVDWDRRVIWQSRE